MGEGGQDSSFGGAPLPKHLGQVSGNHCVIASGWEPLCQYQVLMDLVWLLSWSEWSKVLGWSKVLCQSPGLLSISVMISKVAPLLHPCKYWLICNFHSNSFLHTNNKPLALPCILCGVSMVVAMIVKSSIQTNFPKSLKYSK